MIRKLMLLGAALALVAAACGDDSSVDDTVVTTTTTLQTTTTAALPDDGGATTAAAVVLAGSSLGDILVDQDGNVLYLFVPDGQGPSVCNDGCAAAWPPLLSGSVAGDGVDAALLGTAARDDGSEQVTYNGWPLYYYADDSAPGDTNGQGVNDVWYVLSVTGEAIGLPEDAEAAVVLAGSSLGDILVDQDGNVLYLFVPDGQGPSVCNDGCAAAWPPLLSGSVAGDGVDAALLGTAARDDGSEQVTYNGWPLYYYADDSAPGDTNGQGVNDVWYVLSATGEAIGI